MRVIGAPFEGLRGIASYAIRSGVERAGAAASAIAGAIPGGGDSVAISEEAKRLAATARGEVDLVDAMLDLERASLSVATGVVLARTADELDREALAIGRRRGDVG